MNEKIDLNNIMNDVQQLINSKLVATIYLKGISPWWGGDYESKTSDHVDEHQIAGKLRWFLKTVYNRFCASDLTSYEEAEAFVSRFLGSTEGTSNYSFKVKDEKFSQSGVYFGLNRYKFVSLNKKDKNNYLPRDVVKMKLEIYRHNNTQYDKIIVEATLITLAYLGIGRGANRGFGRFVPENCNVKTGNSVCQKILYGDVLGAFNEFYSDFNKLNGCQKNNSWENSYVPVASDFNKKPLSYTECKTNNIVSILNCIQASVMKSTLKQLSFKISLKDPGPFIHTWIYGLPRQSKKEIIETTYSPGQSNKQQKKQKIMLGYVKNKEYEELRRQSMFVISPVVKNGRYFVCVLPFLSLLDNQDALNDLYHVGIHQNEPNKPHKVKILEVIQGINNLYPYEKTLASKNKDLSYGNGNLTNLINKYHSELVKNLNYCCNNPNSFFQNKSYLGNPGNLRSQSYFDGGKKI